MYGGDRGELELGTCEVSIPKDHEVGEMESPSVLRLEFREDPERHVVLLGVEPESADEFYADLRSCVGRSAGKEAFVFVHGYNVGFETAVRRTAQIAYDLKFEGAPIVYSWPSQEGLLAYTVDETNVVWTVPHLKEFLLGVARQSGAKSVHLVAHSMGNRALTSALRELALELKADCPRFHEVVLTAPDIDADVFRRDLAPAIVGVADRVTLYASSNDEALIASQGRSRLSAGGRVGRQRDGRSRRRHGGRLGGRHQFHRPFLLRQQQHGAGRSVRVDPRLEAARPAEMAPLDAARELTYWKFLREKWTDRLSTSERRTNPKPIADRVVAAPHFRPGKASFGFAEKGTGSVEPPWHSRNVTATVLAPLFRTTRCRRKRGRAPSPETILQASRDRGDEAVPVATADLAL